MNSISSGDFTQACSRDFFAPDTKELRSIDFHLRLSLFCKRSDISAGAFLDFILMELLWHHVGTLHDFDGNPIDLESEDKNGDTLLDRIWGADPARTINRIREAASRPRRNRTKMTSTIMMRLLLIHYAREIWNCRTQGLCSSQSTNK